jgi:hypothetical protein
MSAGATTAFAAYVPVLVCLVASFFTYRQAVRVSNKTAQTEGRKSDLAEYEALNRAQAAELERERTYRQQDGERYAARIARLETRVTASEEKEDQLMLWVEDVAAILRRPRVAAILQDEGVMVPAAPTESRREYV